MGTLGCVFIDNETHESGVTKCTTGEAWNAFSWHHSYIETNKAVSQWLLTFNLCVSVTWPLTCAFHIPCTHTPEIIDMHRGVCDNVNEHTTKCSHYKTKVGDAKLSLSHHLWCNDSSHESSDILPDEQFIYQFSYWNLNDHLSDPTQTKILNTKSILLEGYAPWHSITRDVDRTLES